MDPARAVPLSSVGDPAPDAVPPDAVPPDDLPPEFGADPLERPPGRWSNLLTPLPRAALFYTRSWRNHLARRGRDGIPSVRPTVRLAGHAFVDELVLTGFRVTGPGRPDEDLRRIGREARAALELYGDLGWLGRPEAAYADPPPLEEVSTTPARSRSLRYERVSFESGYAPHPGDPARDRWLAYTANRTAWAWVLRHDEPRPWLVCVHGTSMGRPFLDLALFRARWLHEDLGLNVVLPVLPLHGPRRLGLPRTSMLPGEDVLDNIHGTLQSVWDTRRLIRWARAQGGMDVGITGVSLGGYVSALVASVEDDLACAILGVPAVDLVALIEHHTPDAAGRQRLGNLELARQLGPVVSPLTLTPRLPLGRRFVYAGLADRLAHPRHHVGPLWEHWGRPRVLWYQGGHAAFSRSKLVGRFVKQALVDSGLVDR